MNDDVFEDLSKTIIGGILEVEGVALHSHETVELPVGTSIMAAHLDVNGKEYVLSLIPTDLS